MSTRAPFPMQVATMFGRWRANENLMLGTIGMLGVLFTILLLGVGKPFNLIGLLAAGVGIVIWLLRRWPVQTALCLPVLIISKQFLKIFAYEPVLLIIAAVLIYHLWSTRSPWLLRFDKLEVAYWLLFGFAAFSFFWVDIPWWWLFGIRKLLIAGVGLWVSWRLARMVPVEFGLLGIALCSCAIGLDTLAQAYKMGWFGSATQNLMRRTATDVGWGTANYIGAVLTILLPSAVYLALGKVKTVFRMVGWAAIPLTILVVTIAASRGGAIMVLIVALFAIFRSHINTWLAILMGTVAVSLLLLGPGAELLLERFSDPKDLASVAVRIYYFKVAWWRIQEFWPLGMGWGQGWGFIDQLRETDPHNYWLVLVSELGLAGIVLWGAVLVILWVYIIRMEKNPATQGLGRSLQLMFVIAQANLMFEPTFQGLQYHFLFYWICGVYLGAYDRQVLKDSQAARLEPSAPAPSLPAPTPAPSPT